MNADFRGIPDPPGSIALEHSPCPMGCPVSDETILTGCDRLHGLPGEFRVVQCRACGLMRTDPRPTRESIGYYYPDTYGPHRNTAGGDPVVSGSPSRRSRLAGRIARFLYRDVFVFHTETVPPLAPGRMLEVGCGTGAFLRKMAAQGWDVEGLEFSERAAETARSFGCAVRTGSLEDFPDPGRKYDLIVLWMVLEHLHDPALGLRKLRRWLSSGGWLVFSVPNAGSLEFRLFREHWYALQLPTHLYHFTPGTARLLLERCGWRAERIFHQRTVSNIAASLGYLLPDRGPAGGLARVLRFFPERGGWAPYGLFPLAYLLSVFGQTGRMTVWAR